MPATDQLLVARIGKPHGLRGEVTVQAHTDDPERRFVPGVAFATEAPAGSGVPRSLTLRRPALHQKVWLLGFEEIPDRTGAEAPARHPPVRRPDDGIDEADDDEDAWYEDELVGLAVVDHRRCQPSARSPAWRPAPPRTCSCVALDRVVAEALVPFVEAIVPEVDVEARPRRHRPAARACSSSTAD